MKDHQNWWVLFTVFSSTERQWHCPCD